MMEEIFSDLLGNTVLIYLDDILIFSNTNDELVGHVQEVLRRLLSNRLLAKLEKCCFSKTMVDFLEYVVSDKGISIAPSKVQAIMDWPTPGRRRDLKSFWDARTSTGSL